MVDCGTINATWSRSFLTLRHIKMLFYPIKPYAIVRLIIRFDHLSFSIWLSLSTWWCIINLFIYTLQIGQWNYNKFFNFEYFDYIIYDFFPLASSVIRIKLIKSYTEMVRIHNIGSVFGSFELIIGAKGQKKRVIISA